MFAPASRYRQELCVLTRTKTTTTKTYSLVLCPCLSLLYLWSIFDTKRWLQSFNSTHSMANTLSSRKIALSPNVSIASAKASVSVIEPLPYARKFTFAFWIRASNGQVSRTIDRLSLSPNRILLGFLRLGMTTNDPSTHRTSAALPRHACPDLTCRSGTSLFFSLLLRRASDYPSCRLLGEMCAGELFWCGQQVDVFLCRGKWRIISQYTQRRTVSPHRSVFVRDVLTRNPSALLFRNQCSRTTLGSSGYLWQLHQYWVIWGSSGTPQYLERSSTCHFLQRSPTHQQYRSELLTLSRSLSWSSSRLVSTCALAIYFIRLTFPKRAPRQIDRALRPEQKNRRHRLLFGAFENQFRPIDTNSANQCIDWRSSANDSGECCSAFHSLSIPFTTGLDQLWY